jgi:hypothetical protein
MNNTGFRVDGGSAKVDFSGSLTSNVANNGGIPSPIIDINNTTGGTINLASGGAPSGSTVANQILDIGGEGILIEANASATSINIGNATLVNSVSTAIAVVNDDSITKIATVPNTAANPAYTSGIVKNTDGSAIVINGGTPNFDYLGSISNAPPAGGGLGYILQIADTFNSTGTQNVISIAGPGGYPLVDSGDGVFIRNVAGNTAANVNGLNLQGAGTTGILVENSQTAGGFNPTFSFLNTKISGATSQAILVSNNAAATQTTFQNLDIALSGANAGGIRAVNAGRLAANGSNTLSASSTSAAAIYVNSPSVVSNLNSLNFTSLTSGNTASTGTARAITIDPTAPAGTGTSIGQVNITGSFTVGRAAGTGANVSNNSVPSTGVKVNVGGTQISP